MQTHTQTHLTTTLEKTNLTTYTCWHNWLHHFTTTLVYTHLHPHLWIYSWRSHGHQTVLTKTGVDTLDNHNYEETLDNHTCVDNHTWVDKLDIKVCEYLLVNHNEDTLYFQMWQFNIGRLTWKPHINKLTWQSHLWRQTWHPVLWSHTWQPGLCRHTKYIL